MTGAVATEQVAAGTVPRPDPPTRGVAPWAFTLAVAIVTAALPLVALLTVGGRPGDTTGWLTLAGPLLVGSAVALSRVTVEGATATLCLVLATMFAPADAVLEGAGPWASAAAIAIYLGVCWVACALGRRLPAGRSVAWLAALVLAGLYGFGFDVPILLAAGWWFVGRTLRHQQQINERLRTRADELAAEQDRFAAEAVRLERARIARELHDVVAHCMTVIVIQARAGLQQVADPAALWRPAVVDTFGAIADAAADAAGDLDVLVSVLDPRAQCPTGLSREAIDALIGRAADTGATVRLDVRGDPETLDPARATVGLRAVQEALTNALRHAPGSAVAVDLDVRGGLTLTVRNGPPAGAGPSIVGTGGGLAGLGDRVRELGGSTSWGPTADGGWRLDVALR